jgi:hypothetical protein
VKVFVGVIVTVPVNVKVLVEVWEAVALGVNIDVGV